MQCNSGIVQVLRQKCLVQRQGPRVLRPDHRVLEPVAKYVPAGLQGRAGRRTERLHVMVGKDYAALCEKVQVWGVCHRVVWRLEAHVVVALRVTKVRSTGPTQLARVTDGCTGSHCRAGAEKRQVSAPDHLPRSSRSEAWSLPQQQPPQSSLRPPSPPPPSDTPSHPGPRASAPRTARADGSDARARAARQKKSTRHC